jgi:hypothetical protein
MLRSSVEEHVVKPSVENPGINIACPVKNNIRKMAGNYQEF